MLEPRPNRYQPATNAGASAEANGPAPNAGRLERYALAYAADGERVYPLWPIRGGVCACPKGAECKDAGKHPLGWFERQPIAPHGAKSATSDPATIARWWSAWPDAGIGLAIPAGLMVLDVDPRHGGREGLAALEAKYGPLPPTRTAETGGGGCHYLLSVPMGVKLAGSLGAGLDVKKAGGGIVAAPSVHASGRAYRWIDAEAPIAEAPAWILEALTAPKRTPATSPRPVTTVSGDGGAVDVLERWTAALLVTQSGGRNETLSRAVYHVAGMAAAGWPVTLDETHAALMPAAEACGYLADHGPADFERVLLAAWRAGYSHPVKSNGWRQRITAVLTRGGGGRARKRCAWAFAFCCRDGKAKVYHAAGAALAGVGPSTFRKYIYLWQAEGLIRVSEPGGREILADGTAEKRPNVYALTARLLEAAQNENSKHVGILQSPPPDGERSSSRTLRATNFHFTECLGGDLLPGSDIDLGLGGDRLKTLRALEVLGRPVTFAELAAAADCTVVTARSHAAELAKLGATVVTPGTRGRGKAGTVQLADGWRERLGERFKGFKDQTAARRKDEARQRFEASLPMVVRRRREAARGPAPAPPLRDWRREREERQRSKTPTERAAAWLAVRPVLASSDWRIRTMLHGLTLAPPAGDPMQGNEPSNGSYMLDALQLWTPTAQAQAVA